MESFKRVKLGTNEFAYSQPAFFGVPSLHCNNISKPISTFGDKKAPASAIFADAVAPQAQTFSRDVQRPVAGDGCDSATTRRTCHFDHVPDELVAEIARCVFAKAQSAADVAGMLVTCRRFSSVCHLAASWSLRASAAIEMLLPADAARWTAAAQRLLLSAAAEGNLEAIYVVGMISFYCLNNHWAGAKLLAQAAEAGHGAAMYSLAIINFHGSGGAADDANPEVGVELSWRAARLGFLPALQELGHCFLDGWMKKQLPAEYAMTHQALTEDDQEVLNVMDLRLELNEDFDHLLFSRKIDQLAEGAGVGGGADHEGGGDKTGRVVIEYSVEEEEEIEEDTSRQAQHGASGPGGDANQDEDSSSGTSSDSSSSDESAEDDGEGAGHRTERTGEHGVALGERVDEQVELIEQQATGETKAVEEQEGGAAGQEGGVGGQRQVVGEAGAQEGGAGGQQQEGVAAAQEGGAGVQQQAFRVATARVGGSGGQEQEDWEAAEEYRRGDER
ncbi:unnamed protein product [Closterium sp. NIES-65]|nr:unnamed protein product [Closterium sp. NIES-65]